MAKSFVELIIGDMGEKRAYRQYNKRVKKLPSGYRATFKKIRHYMYHFDGAGCDIETMTDLVDLFEQSAAEGKKVKDLVGSDVSGFCDELIRVSTAGKATTKEKLNQEILQYFNKEGK